MKKLFALIIVSLCSLSLHGQNLTTVSSSNITDINGTKLAAGQLCFLITDQQDNPISVSIGGGGQALKRGYCSPVTAGVVTSFTVPEPAHTSPAGIYYRVSVKDSSTGQEVLRYTQVSFTGATFNFDNYAPLNLGSAAPLTGTSVTGNLSVTGNVAATGTVTGSNIPGNILQQIFNAGTGLTQRTAMNFFSGITCVDNAGTSRTDCRLGPLVTVASSATPVFDCNNGNNFKNVLTANVTSSTLVNCAAGEPVAILVVENATGGFTFVPPTNIQGWLPISTAANANNLQIFLYDGSNAQPDLLAGLTGDVTSSPGSTATTVAKIQGTTVSGTTGSGAAVLATSPALVTPNIGVATGTSLIASSKLTAGAAAAGGSTTGDITAARSTTSGAFYLGSDGSGFLFRNGNTVTLQGTSLVWTMPATTDTLVGKATTDILTGKSYDTAGAGNVLKFNGIQVTNPPAVFFGSCTGTASSSVTIVLSGVGCSNSTGFQFPSSSARTMQNLRCHANTGGVNASSGVVTLRKNGVGSALTCTFGTGTSCSDITHTVAFAAADLWDVTVTTQAAETLAGLNCQMDGF